MKPCLLILALALSSNALVFDQATLTTFLETARADMKMPGLRAAVRYSDSRIVRAATGLADKEARTPLDSNIGMPGGGTGIPFVAALTMLLVEEGTLSLEDLVADWLGDNDWYHRLPNADTIEVRHLLSHTSGIADYPDSRRWHAAMYWRVLRKGSAYFEPEELIHYSLNKKAPFPAGQGFGFSDTGYLVLGLVLEAATGREYFDLLKERILVPQQLVDVRPQDQSILTGITPGYSFGARNLKKDGRMKYDPRSEWTGGGLVTTPTMLVEFFAALAGGRIVEPESLAMMLDGGWHDSATPGEHYGYGLFVYGDGASFGHGGMWPGYRTYVTHDLTTGITIAVQTNRDGRVDMPGLVARIAALVPPM